jgi:HSP20 family protein
MSQLLPERRSRRESEQWEPTNQLEPVVDRMRRLLEQTFGSAADPSLATDGAVWAPLVDIEEEDDAYVLEVELPGVKKDDVNIEVVGNEVTISGELKERERVGIVRRRTRPTGRFYYRVTLPNRVDADSVEAKLSGGVLTIRIPKSEAASRRRIEVKS